MNSKILLSFDCYKIVFAFFLAFPLGFYLEAQPRIVDTIPEEWNFFKQDELMRRSFAKIAEQDSVEDHRYKEYLRWRYLWKDRVDAAGDMRVYSRAMSQHYGAKSGQSLCEDDCGFSCFPSNWSYLGPKNLSTQSLGKILCTWVNPTNDQHILAGADGGLWKTLDGGQHWEILTDFCLPGVGIADIAVQPNNIDRIYVSSTGWSGFGHGIFKTEDGGVSWVKLNMGLGNQLENKLSWRIVIHPVDHDNLYALVGHEVFKTTDGGNTWQVIFSNAQNPNELTLRDLELIPSVTSDIIYVTGESKRDEWTCSPLPPETYCFTSHRRFRAKVWMFESAFDDLVSSAHDDVTDDLPGYPNDCHLAMLSFTGNSLNIVCLSSGITFYKKIGTNPWTSTIANTSTIGCFNWIFSFPFEVSPVDDNVIYLGGTTLKKSLDGGVNFNCVNCSPWCIWTISCSNCSWSYWAYLSNPNFAGSHPDVRYLTIYQGSPGSSNDILFFGTDGGLGKSIDGGNSSLNLNGENLQLSQFYGIASSEIQPNHIYGGTQDNGVFDNTNQSWRVKTNGIGDAYETAVDPNNPNIAYTTNNGGKIYKTTNGGQSWIASLGPDSCPVPDKCGGKPLFVNNIGELFVGEQNLWKWNGTTWINLTNLTLNSNIVAFNLSNDGNTAYIAYDGITWDGVTPANLLSEKVYKVVNVNSGSPIVTDITPGLDGIRWSGITGLAIEPGQAEKVWVCFGNFWESSKKVFRYDSNTNTWEEYGQGLPNIPSQDLVYWKESLDLLFIGMDDGVYYRDAGMEQWELFSCNLPRSMIFDLGINYSLKKLRAATYSRGIWESPIPKKYFASCRNQTQHSVSINPSGGFPTNTIMTNGQTHIVNSKFASVSLNLIPYCIGNDCCGSQENLEWKVYKKRYPNGPESLYKFGTGSYINFFGQFRSGFFFFITRYIYRIEIKGTCGNNNCSDITLSFRGI